MFGCNFSLGSCVHLDGYQGVIAVIQVIYNKTDKYSCLNKLFNSLFFFSGIYRKRKQLALEWGG